MRIATVVEGPSDHDVIQTVINRLIPGKHRYSSLQPIGTMNEKTGDVVYGETGAGWKGVRRWCRETWQRPGSNLEMMLGSVTNDPIDLLILHLDADVIANDDLQDGNPVPIADVNAPCPPAQTAIENLKQIVLAWLQLQTLPPTIIFMIPSQDTETWTFAALYPNDLLCSAENFECVKFDGPKNEHPGYLLTTPSYGKRLAYKDGKVKKSGHLYQDLLPAIGKEWDTVCKICTQAQIFSQDIRQRIQNG